MQTQTFMGLSIVALSVLGLSRTAVILNASNMVRRLAERTSPARALLVVRGLLVIAILFGLALAAGLINPRV